ncbi:MAG: 50S ribosomal protein L24 [Chloroflexia bacterium]
MNVHKGDTVVVITGEDKGKRGVVRQVNPAKNKVTVEHINVMRKHTRGRSGARQAGIIEIEAPMNASKVMVWCPDCRKPVRVGHSYMPDGTKIRVCPQKHQLDDFTDPDKHWK